MPSISDIINKIDFNKLRPLTGDMTKEENREFLLKIIEAIARGATEGAVRGRKENTSEFTV